MRKGARKHATARTAGRSRLARGAAVALLSGAACAAATSAVAQPAVPTESAAAPGATTGEPVVRLASKDEEIKVVERFSKVVTLPDRIARVDGFDQDVIDVTALDSRSIRVHAKAPGVTTMTLLDERDQTYSVDVLVVGDVRHLQELLARLFPNAAVEVVEVRESVVLRGWVTEPHQITEIVEIAEQFYPLVLNQMQVGCVQQVMLKVKVMEVQRSKLREMGFNFLHISDDGLLSSTPGNLIALQEIQGQSVTLAEGSLAAPTAIFGIFNPNSSFYGFVEALKTEGLLKVIAEPNLVTMNGRPATLHSGGSFPVLQTSGFGAVNTQYKDYGTLVHAVPIVLSSDRVRLEIQAEVSDLDFANGVVQGDVRIPATLERSANTQVELNFGETLVIAGLIQTSDSGRTSKIPVLGDLPYVGAAFRRVAYQQDETELVIMVTPELVAPLAPGQIPPGGLGLFTDTPTDRELYGLGMLEVPSYGPHCEGQCPPPIPTYDPYHPVGPEHIAPPSAMMGPPLPPPTALPPGPAPMGPTPAINPGPGDFPPPAPSTSGVGNARRPVGTAARPAPAVTPTGHSRTTMSRPGLIGPTRPAARP